MKVLALFKDVNNKETEEKDKLLEKGWDFAKDTLKTIISTFASDTDKKSILLMPQYVTSFSMGKGFGVYYDKLEKEYNDNGKYGTKKLNLLTTEDCLIKIAGKIVTFDLEKSYKEVEKETKGGSNKNVLHRQKIGNDILSYTMNIHVVSSLTKWALEYQIHESPEVSSKGKGDKLIDKIAKDKKKKEKIVNKKEESELSTMEIPVYNTLRKSLLIVLFRETGDDDEMTEEEKKELQKKDKLDTPGVDSMSIGNYLENMLSTTNYIPIRHMFFPEVELSSYKEASTPEEKAEGDFIIVVKRPGDSKYPVSVSDPVSEGLGILGDLGGNVWDNIQKAMEKVYGFRGGKNDNA